MVHDLLLPDRGDFLGPRHELHRPVPHPRPAHRGRAPHPEAVRHEHQPPAGSGRHRLWGRVRGAQHPQEPGLGRAGGVHPEHAAAAGQGDGHGHPRVQQAVRPAGRERRRQPGPRGLHRGDAAEPPPAVQLGGGAGAGRPAVPAAERQRAAPRGVRGHTRRAFLRPSPPVSSAAIFFRVGRARAPGAAGVLRRRAYGAPTLR
mmetsp:Transcript_13191/g.18374  ORF Transcript_13191/g.18374 Transcript_13191/m.18374 type:complete len:202 (-) Transcript_13191:61-666(-)